MLLNRLLFLVLLSLIQSQSYCQDCDCILVDSILYRKMNDISFLEKQGFEIKKVNKHLEQRTGYTGKLVGEKFSSFDIEITNKDNSIIIIAASRTHFDIVGSNMSIMFKSDKCKESGLKNIFINKTTLKDIIDMLGMPDNVYTSQNGFLQFNYLKHNVIFFFKIVEIKNNKYLRNRINGTLSQYKIFLP